MARPSNTAGFNRGKGDETHNPVGVLEILMPGEGTVSTYARQIHVAQASDGGTDWNVAAQSHPTLYLHSVTTPATDYLTIGGHDGTTGYINVVGGTTVAIQVSGTSHLTVAANAISHSAANSGAVSTLTVDNTSDDSGAGALVRVQAGGSSASGDAFFTAREGAASHAIAIGVDTSSNIGVIAMEDTLGTADGDAIRFTDAAPPVQSFNAAHSSTTFDYVCDDCGNHGATMFQCECGGSVAWHDDVLALSNVLASANGLRFTGEEPGIQHLAKLGVMEVTPSDVPEDNGKNWIGLRPVAAQWYTWSAMQQMCQRIEELESKLALA